MSLSLSEVQILNEDIIVLWGVRGNPNYLFPSKLAAEVAARNVFPCEMPDERYSRIFYTTFVPQD